jgi:proteasome alpha subunit
MNEERESYDQSTTIFSPDGRMFQVEYAREAVKKGSVTVGMIYDKGVLLIVEKRIQFSLVIPESILKIFRLDENIACSTSGLIADARILVDYARDVMADYEMRYSEKMSVSDVIKRISNIKRIYTQYGGIRPFGVSFLIGGVDEEGVHLFETDPSGAYKKYFAGAIGEGYSEISEILEDNYKPNIKLEPALTMIFQAMTSVLNRKISDINVEVVTVTNDKKFQRIPDDEIEKIKKKL